ncbi:MAG TPA: formate dehydrogenase subunit delta [Steroidobacteraceae bacterium]|jgi:formate dehydrogenase subunit delta|nr:formate dehydrogenase subunit delta [Steroidobacteraceae bacterium]
MNVDLLIKMANQISEFFVGSTDDDKAAHHVANHLRRYWDPRMRTQIIAYYEQRHGAGLNDTALKAIGLLKADKPPPQGAGGAPTGAKA